MRKKEVVIDDALKARLQQVVETLEAVAVDRRLLAGMTPEERTRLVIAAGNVYNPDPATRRRMAKAVVRLREAEKIKQDEAARAQTGIRELRRRPVFNTPNYLPPPATPQGAPVEPAEPVLLLEDRCCSTCKRDFR